MKLSRLLILAMLPLTLSIGCAKSGKTAKAMPDQIEMTGIESFDSLFRQAKDIDSRLDSARSTIRDGKNQLNSALGLADGTPFKDAIADLQSKAQGKLKLAMNGSTPQLTVSDAVPANVQAAVDSLNGTLNSYKSAIDDVAGIKGDVQNLLSASKALPSQLQSDFKNLNVGLTELPGKLRTVNDNLKLIGNMPNRVTKLSTALANNVTVVTGTFNGSGGGASSSTSTSSSSSSSGGSRDLGK